MPVSLKLVANPQQDTIHRYAIFYQQQSMLKVGLSDVLLMFPSSIEAGAGVMVTPRLERSIAWPESTDPCRSQNCGLSRGICEQRQFSGKALLFPGYIDSSSCLPTSQATLVLGWFLGLVEGVIEVLLSVGVLKMHTCCEKSGMSKRLIECRRLSNAGCMAQLHGRAFPPSCIGSFDVGSAAPLLYVARLPVSVAS